MVSTGLRSVPYFDVLTKERQLKLAVRGARFILTYTNLQDLADQCAEKQNSLPPTSPQQFAIRNASGETNCYTGLVSDQGVSQSCDTAAFNAAFYM